MMNLEQILSNYKFFTYCNDAEKAIILQYVFDAINTHLKNFDKKETRRLVHEFASSINLDFVTNEIIKEMREFYARARKQILGDRKEYISWETKEFPVIEKPKTKNRKKPETNTENIRRNRRKAV